MNVSEKYFIGVYRKEGIHRVSQGPYPGRGRSPLVKFSAGLSQHFKGGIPPVIKDVPLETLDWGEVWAMKEFMRHVLPNDLTLPEDGYWVWQNGWWARLCDIKPGILDQLRGVYPREGTDLGVYEYGEEFLYDIPLDGAVVVALEPVLAGSTPRHPTLKNQPEVLVVPAFGSP